MKQNESAISPVIGMILMVAITVIVAGVIAMIVFSSSPPRYNNYQTHTANITIDGVNIGGPSAFEPSYIYSKQKPHTYLIYWSAFGGPTKDTYIFAESHIGSTIVVHYKEYYKDGCKVREIVSMDKPCEEYCSHRCDNECDEGEE
jgi:flagellin-like protein